jgi:hypothetical protein
MVCALLLITGCATTRNPESQGNSAPARGRGPNLIRNGDFARALQNWSTLGDGPNTHHPDDPGRAAFKVEKGALSIEIRDQGISIWSVMLYQGVSFEKGATYDVSFEAESDSGVRVVSNVTQDGTWRNFSGDRSFKLTAAMTACTYHFTMSEGGEALFQLCLGTSGTGKVRLGSIAIRKRGGG